VSERAVITGVGVVSPLGVGRRTFWGALAEGKSAVAPIRWFDARTFPTRVAGEVPIAAFHPGELAEALALPDAPALCAALAAAGALRDRKVGLALLAAAEAWRDAGCGAADAHDAWLVLALGLEQAFLEDFAPVFSGGDIAWADEPAAALPEIRFRAPADTAAGAVRRLFGLGGPWAANVSACAAGALAVAQAAALIRRGAAGIVLCGAADSMVNPRGFAGMSRLGAPSPRNAPDACRPFDRRRDGLVVGEGAALFVVEAESRARARGARPLAEVLGWGSTQDGYRVTAPRPDGAAAAAAIARALARAGLPPEAVGYVNAHGTGTPLGDVAECRAIHHALGGHAHAVPVSSIKGAVGHLMAAAGAVEIAACLLPLERDLLPGTAHFAERDPECDLDIVGPTPRPAAAVEVVLSNSFGFGGQNASVLLGRCAP
jgi:3-oxoacyl-[acyl-carrier-protein] synthase II